jgi:hypothetical protein
MGKTIRLSVALATKRDLPDPSVSLIAEPWPAIGVVWKLAAPLCGLNRLRACTGAAGPLAAMGLARWKIPFVDRRRASTGRLTVRFDCCLDGAVARDEHALASQLIYAGSNCRKIVSSNRTHHCFLPRFLRRSLPAVFSALAVRGISSGAENPQRDTVAMAGQESA